MILSFFKDFSFLFILIVLPPVLNNYLIPLMYFNDELKTLEPTTIYAKIKKIIIIKLRKKKKERKKERKKTNQPNKQSK